MLEMGDAAQWNHMKRRIYPRSSRGSPGKDQPFHKRFSVDIHMEEAHRRFINRAMNQIFEFIFVTDDHLKEYKYLYVRNVANELGEAWSSGETFGAMIKRDFLRCLQAVEIIHLHLVNDFFVTRIQVASA